MHGSWCVVEYLRRPRMLNPRGIYLPDDNRSYLEDAGFPHTVVSLLEGYAEQVVADQTAPLALSLPDLKIVKTAIGVLLNSSVGYGTPLQSIYLTIVSNVLAEPIRDRLVSLEAPYTILKLAVAIYPPGAWIHAEQPTVNGDHISTDQAEEVWAIRVTLSQWAWRTISELSEDGDEKREFESTAQTLAIEVY